MNLFTAYSFADVNASIVGPSGAFSLGSDSGAAEGGITVEMISDKDTMLIGADGSVMHSLNVGQGATVTIRLLKVSPVNLALSALYAIQSSSSVLWGTNTIVISDLVRGDVVTCLSCAFKRFPSNTWSRDGNVMEWVFNVGIVTEVLGAGGLF